MPLRNSSSTRSRSSFTIYRDDPESSTNERNSHQTTTSTSTPTSRQPTAQTLSIKDKENSHPYGGTSTQNKSVKPPLGKRSCSAPMVKNSLSSPVLELPRTALATKFLLDSKSSRSSKSKAKAISEEPEPRTTAPSTSRDEKPIKSQVQRLKLRKSSSGSSSRTKSRSELLLSSASARLTRVVEDEAAVCGDDGLTLADRRAVDLTQSPLADISAAYPTSEPPPSFHSSSPRKRSRALTLYSDSDSTLATPLAAERPITSSTDDLRAKELYAQLPATDSAIASCSPSSPHKRLRLSPKLCTSQLSVSPSSQTTAVEAMSEEQEVELQLTSDYHSAPPSPI
ncbi:hypothetical protein FRC03_010931 [Tulasnella sp. 419]|nr:hypothetical protein FRC03_010931 [Tulasnella sp. 419]